MPVYEFFCPFCNTVFSFLSKSVNTTKQPDCPHCKTDSLTRRISLISTISGSKKDSDGAGDNAMNLPIDESRMEQAARTLAAEVDRAGDSDDPRQAAKLLQKFSKMSGLKLKDSFQDALSRMEAGEDPELLEKTMGDAGDDEMPFEIPGEKKRAENVRLSYRRDPELYEM
jgi:putative FmdB family regulatory protein